jgi:hypothetical protein
VHSEGVVVDAELLLAFAVKIRSVALRKSVPELSSARVCHLLVQQRSLLFGDLGTNNRFVQRNP